MSFAKRLTKIETSLTPKQSVLLWLEEAQRFETDEYLEKLVNLPLCDAPRVRFPQMAEKAVRESLRKKGMKPEVIARAELDAWKQADSLIVLVLNLVDRVEETSVHGWFTVAFLEAELLRIAHQFEEHDVFNAKEWDIWRMCLINSVTELWLLQATIAAISEQYYDNHSILFRDQECDLNRCIQRL